MNPTQTETQLKTALVANGGHEEARDYLGMSSIGYCSRKIYNDLVNGKSDDEHRLDWYGFAGRMWEAALIRLLGHTPPAEQIEVVSKFNTRFRGHVDFVLPDGTLIECKSVDWGNFTKLYGGPKREHIDQVQMYLRHGGWQRALIIYAARDIVWREWNGIPIRVFEILPDERRQNDLDAKAADLLARLDAGDPPPCECGWCRL